MMKMWLLMLKLSGRSWETVTTLFPRCVSLPKSSIVFL